MKGSVSVFSALIIVSVFVAVFSGIGCANIIPPSGGPRDSLPPVLVAETPINAATNIYPKKITFVFDEYVELQNQQENLLVSPNPSNMPVLDARLRTITVKLRDTLEEKTTYVINFGNAIRDLNEGNVLKDFTYVFSTGSFIDSLTLSGKVTIAETGKIDTTLVAILHRNIDDSAVIKEKPRYIAKLNSEGKFTFNHLPKGTYALYALPNDYGHRYNETKLFAFADKPIVVSDSTPAVSLLAYVDSIRPPAQTATPSPKKSKDSTLAYTLSLQGDNLDLLTPFYISLSRPIASFDSSKITLTDESFKPVGGYSIKRDTSDKRFLISNNWKPGALYNLLIQPGSFIDSSGIGVKGFDTIDIKVRPTESYGSAKLRFVNLDTSKHPVLLLLQNDVLVKSVPLTQRDWVQKLIEPGEYEIRILYDKNRNGQWDKGQFFGTRRQPEVVIVIRDPLTIRENWDNEKDITL